jgi:hypothetical protein
VEHDLHHTIALLSHTPAAIDALLRGLPDAWTTCNEGESTWTVVDVVGHLVYCERVNWMPRVRQFGKSEAFKHFDRRGHLREIPAKSLGQLLDEFSQLRSENISELRSLNLQPEDLAMRAEHPVLGPATLSQLLATWTAHDLTHLHQISRVMAHQYREAVGPFIRNLGVLRCSGHSSAG